MKKLNALDVYVGQKLKQMREKAGLRLPTLATAIGVDPEKLQAFEQGAASVPAEALLNLAIVLRFDAIELLKGTPLRRGAARSREADLAREPELVTLLRNFRKIRDPEARVQILAAVAIAAEKSAKNEK